MLPQEGEGKPQCCRKTARLRLGHHHKRERVRLGCCHERAWAGLGHHYETACLRLGCHHKRAQVSLGHCHKMAQVGLHVPAPDQEDAADMCTSMPNIWGRVRGACCCGGSYMDCEAKPLKEGKLEGQVAVRRLR